jgi:hypothetical protein
MPSFLVSSCSDARVKSNLKKEPNQAVQRRVTELFAELFGRSLP